MRSADKEKEKRDIFVDNMNDLFDIAHSEALEHMKNEEDKSFLILERQKRMTRFYAWCRSETKTQRRKDTEARYNGN